MSTALRFVILFGVFSVTLGYNIRDDAPWFKNHERITDRFLVGKISGRNSICNGTQNGVQVEGVCVSNRECTNLGGVRGGSCSFLGTCCIIKKACSNSTKAKLSYFVAPSTVQSDCSLTIQPINRDVCQIRLDFEKFSIAQPTRTSREAAYRCNSDAFTVTASTSNLGFEHLCGENGGQHIYVPVSDANNIVLRFQSNYNQNSLGFAPDWQIKIRQLECGRSQSLDINNIHSTLATMHHNHFHKQLTQNNDQELIAPAGCLQYYPERTGTYETFNFKMETGSYIGKTNYAICFKRSPDVCGIRHTADTFFMDYTVVTTEDNKREAKCFAKDDETNSLKIPLDYLQIPGGITLNSDSEFYCSSMLNKNRPVTSVSPGPINVVVRTDAYTESDGVQRGFRINYQLLTSGCNV